MHMLCTCTCYAHATLRQSSAAGRAPPDCATAPRLRASAPPRLRASAPHTVGTPRRWRNRVNRGGSRDEGTPENVTHLPRGGVYVQTKHGSVQFGMPPETIKDSLNLGLEVPSIFVPPKDRFNLKYGTNCCEIEFPAYWNFFVKGRLSIVATSADAAEVIQKVVDEVREDPVSEHA
jgi:hypothetical protein